MNNPSIPIDLLYRGLFNQSPDGILIIDESGAFIDFNDAAHRQLGYTRDEFARLRMSDVDSGENTEEIQEKINKVMAGELVEFEVKHRTKGGEIRDVWVINQALTIAGRTVAHVIWRDITERKRADAELKKFYILFETASDLMVIADPNGAFQKVNPACTATLGYSEAELISKPFIEFIHPDDRQATRTEMEKQLKRGFSANFENRYLCKDGSLRWLSWRAIYLERDKATYATARDITELKKAEAEREHFLKFFNTSNDLMCLATPNGYFKRVNPAWTTMLGYGPVELLEKPLTEFIHPDDVEPTLREIERQISGKYTINFVNRYRCKDGSFKWIEWRATPPKNNIIYGIGRDITQRKKADDARLQSEKQFRALFESTPFGVVVVDTERRIINCNQAFGNMIGYSLEELRTLSVPDISHAEDDLANRGYYQQLIEGRIKSFTMEKRYVRKDGATLWTSLTGAIIRNADGAPQAFFGIIEDITDRKKAAEALQESEARLHAIFEQSNDGINVLNMEGRYRMVNSAFCNMTGYSREELLKMRVYDLIPDQVTPKLFPEVARLRQSGRREVELLRKDGSTFFAAISGSAIQIGSSEYAVGIVQDITERMRAAEALSESERKYKTLFNLSPDGVLLINTEGVIVDFNDQTCSQLGYTREEFKNVRLFEIDPVETRDEIEARLKIIAREGKAEFAVKHRAKNGDVRDVHVITRTIDLAGQTFYHAIWRDITEQKKAEAELKASITRAEEEKAKVEAIMAAIGEGMVIRDRDFRIIYQNQIHKNNSGDLTGRFCYEVFHNFDRVCDGCPVQQAFEDGNIHERSRSVNTPTGLRHFEVLASPVRDPNGTIIAGIELTRDVTESRRIQEELEMLNRTLSFRVTEETEKNRVKDQLLQLQSRQAAMGEMINNIAHQWRQPLNNLGLTVQGLQAKFDRRELTEDVLKEKVKLSMSLINYMSQTITDFTNFFRKDKAITKFPVAEVVKTAVGFMETSLKRNAIEVIIDVSEDIAVSGYRNEYTQVVVNILTNARDVLIDREIKKPVIRLHAFRENGSCILTIADNGGGVPEPIRDNLFRPFVTTKEDGKGTGIGLYISKTIIENNMRGKLSAMNSAEGALFRIETQG